MELYIASGSRERGINQSEGLVKSQPSVLVHALRLAPPDSHPPCLLSQLDHPFFHVTAPGFWDHGPTEEPVEAWSQVQDLCHNVQGSVGQDIDQSWVKRCHSLPPYVTSCIQDSVSGPFEAPYSPTQLSQTLQCEVRGGRNILQVKQYLSFTICPLIITSRVRGGGRYVELPVLSEGVKRENEDTAIGPQSSTAGSHSCLAGPGTREMGEGR